MIYNHAWEQAKNNSEDKVTKAILVICTYCVYLYKERERNKWAYLWAYL